jgi:UDP-glucuronate 4-epimerase
MAPILFTRRILAGEPIEVFNHGRHTRDFTYIDDIVEGVIRVLDRVPTGDPAFDALNPDPATSAAPYRVYNIGNHQPVELAQFIQTLEAKLGRTAQKIMRPLQAGDMPDTYADITELARDTGYAPTTTVEVGVGRFVDWYRAFYRIDPA